MASGEEEEEEEVEIIPQTEKWKKDARDIGVVLDPEWLRALIDGWKEECVLCKIKGRISRDHRHWTQCYGGRKDKENIAEAIRILEEVRFADFSHCKWCYRSQAVCELWDRSVNWQHRVVFKKRKGSDCEYGRWLLEASAAFLAFGAGGGLEEWKARDMVIKPGFYTASGSRSFYKGPLIRNCGGEDVQSLYCSRPAF